MTILEQLEAGQESARRREAERTPRLLLTRADDVRLIRVEWLAKERIPRGGMTLFDGPGGIGKTTFLIGVIAAATCGRDFFTNEEIDAQSCLIIGVEDRRELIAQRLKLCKADMKRVFFVDAAKLGDQQSPLVLPDHVSLLEKAIEEHGVGFVYIDALFSHIALHGEGKMAQHVRAALRPIGEMCDRQNVAFAAMRHWSKGSGSASARALGSAEFTNFARSVFTFGLHPNDEKIVVCAHTKSNYAKQAQAIGFTIVAHDVVDENGRPWQVTTASNVGIVDGVTSDDLAMRVSIDPDERNGAADWLQDYLGDGKPHPSQDAFQAARKAGISRRTLQRAVNSLGVIVSRTSTFPAVGMWQLRVDGVEEPSSRNAGAPH